MNRLEKTLRKHEVEPKTKIENLEGELSTLNMLLAKKDEEIHGYRKQIKSLSSKLSECKCNVL